MSGYRYPIGAGSMAGMCAVGDGLGDTDTDAESSTSATASTSTVGSETSSTTHDVQPTSDVASSSSTSGDTDPAATSIATTDASTTTGDPPQSCGDQTCSGCASCVMEASGDCSLQANACFSVEGCMEASVCMIACSVDDDCTQDCCLGLSQIAVNALIELHACSAKACAPACNLFDDLQCN